MATTRTKVGDYEIVAGCVIDRGAFRAAVMIRVTPAKGDVSAVGYIFTPSYATQAEAEEAAEARAQTVTTCPCLLYTSPSPRDS